MVLNKENYFKCKGHTGAILKFKYVDLGQPSL